MIDNYVTDIDSLKLRIQEAKIEDSLFKPKSVKGKDVYPLGRIIKYEDFLMLAFSHFNEQNNAYIKIGEYEQLLIRMWAEIRRVYAAQPIVIPLLGGGITTIEGISNKNYTDFLKCILCTLRISKFQSEQGIKIVLTQDSIEKIDMNVIKEEF